MSSNVGFLEAGDFKPDYNKLASSNPRKWKRYEKAEVVVLTKYSRCPGAFCMQLELRMRLV